MLTRALLLTGTLLSSAAVNAQVFSRELGDFDLRMGTQPSRSMAQGLVKPTSPGSTFHGGLDLTHNSGWYVGQWAPTMGLKPGSNLEVDSYLGYKHPFDQTLSYELGMIHYSYPKVSPMDSQQFYAGLTVLGTRFGAAFSNDPDRRDSTVFADLGANRTLGVGVSLKYTTHQLGTPVSIADGGLAVAGERTVIAGTGPLLLASAATANKHGAQVLRIAEQARLGAVSGFAAQLWRWPSKALQAVALANGSYTTSTHVLAALGEDRLEAVRLQVGRHVEEIACDRLACGFGLVPNVEIARALGCAMQDRAIAVNQWQASSLTDHYAAGECTGFGGSELALVEGRIAGLAAIGQMDQARALWPQRRHWQGFADRLNQAFALGPALKQLARPDTLVCRCEDVAYAELAGHPSWNAAKLTTRCGMGPCQGRICGTAAQTLFGWEPPQLRPPFSPARIATLVCLDEPASTATPCGLPRDLD